jgi:protein SCO1/2
MKNKSYIGVAFIVLVFGIIFIPRIVDRIKNGTTVQNDRMSYPNENNNSNSLQKMSKAPQFQLTDQDNKTITNADYKNKVYVVEFFFSTCPSICPIMNKNMLEIEKKFIANPNFGIVSITINPENDTPKVLKEHATTLGVKSPNWHFLTGDKKYIMNLSNTGFKLFSAQNDKVAGGFEHSGLFALVDKDGYIRCRKDDYGNPIMYYSGLDKKGIQEITEDITKLLNE